MRGERASERWRRRLEEWAIPDRILLAAPVSPWVLPPSCFTAETNPPNSSTTKRSLDLLRSAGSAPTVLDVGCGAGRASLHLVPPAVAVVGVDKSQPLLEQLRTEAASRRVPVEAFAGEWTAIEGTVPSADLVVCSQVLYNVPEIEPFLRALQSHAQLGVVVEIDTRHPLAKLNGAWNHFWGLERPRGPTAMDLLDVLAELGIRPHIDVVELRDHKGRIGPADIERTRVRLCLTEDRDPDIRQFLETEQRPGRQLATIWWER